MDWITPQLALGDIDDAIHIEDLRKAGVTAILCLNGFPTFLRFEGFVWRNVPLADGPGNHPSAIREALETLDMLVKKRHKVLVHCAEGTSRAPFIMTCYLNSYQNMNWRDALRLVTSQRPFTAINPALLSLYASR